MMKKKVIKEDKQQCDDCKHKIKGIVEVKSCPRCNSNKIKIITEPIK
ncbi:MAG: hypothetical protein PF569_08080 [Candidatus Woesearchaeota archaeon]|jgi:Zn finger protein HypA/HybF involved in hydrogenase expression|nr:hypothetical protein [Candidatus Woesearchaeota archaeon]